MDNTLSPDAFAEILAAAEPLIAVARKHGAIVTTSTSTGIVSFHPGGAQPAPVGVVEQYPCGKDPGRFICTAWRVGEIDVRVYGPTLPVMREAV